MIMKASWFSLIALSLLWPAGLAAQDRPGPPARSAVRGSRGSPPGPQTTGDYASDIVVVRDAQAQALDQVQSAGEEAQDARAQAAAASAVSEMEKALALLDEAKSSPAKLPSALAAEQAAYQALLKLSAREFQVSRSRNRGQQAGNRAGQPNQRQLDQLDLRSEENRYETQRQATPQQTPQQREQLAVLNRLKELAQRQQDLNQRLQELQTALQEARTETERADIREQLKRLRDQEREMLADVDELRQRMDRPENQSRMSDAREQLDQTRSQVQRAADELDKQAVSQALANSTRAERQLEQLRDDFRKQSSGQFVEEMRQMREEARQLAQREEQIRQGIAERADPQRKSLSDAGKTQELVNQIAEQRATLTNLFSQMRDISDRAEVPEPLLSKELYDTLRKAMQQNTDNALSMTSELVRRSFPEQAGPIEQRARQDINELKRGVEQAAGSVLGDETEALRQAKRELDDLTQQVQREIAQATGQDGSSSNLMERGTANVAGGARTNLLGLAGEPGERTNSLARQLRNFSAEARRAQTGQARPDNPDTASQREAQAGQPGERGQQPGGERAGQPGAERGGQPAQLAQGGGRQNQDQSSTAAARGGNRAGLSGLDQPGERAGNGVRLGGNYLDRGGYAGGWYGGWYGPLTGTNYVDWYERLGNVEEMVDSADLRAQLARIRDRARVIRDELRHTGVQPKWPLVDLQVAQPLAEVRDRVAEELARRESAEALVPIDRDPVPTRYSELVRKYYETLGAGR